MNLLKRKSVPKLKVRLHISKMQFYPDEEENPEYWWDVELDDVRHEVYSIEKDEDDPYNQYREWEGKISRENKVASFRFVHHYMIDGDAELEGNFPEDQRPQEDCNPLL